MADKIERSISNPVSLPTAYGDAMKVFMQSGQYSDLCLTCKGRKFLVHRIIVCSHSSVFKVACEGMFLEAQTQSITLDDDDPEALQQLISYMYTFDYQDYARTSFLSIPESTSTHDEQTSEPTEEEPEPATEIESSAESEAEPDTAELFSSVRVYAIADKYDVVGLKDLARTRFEAWAKVHWMSEHFPAMVAEVFETTPAQDSGLRDVAVSVIITNIASFTFNPMWHDVISDHGQLGAQLLEMNVAQNIALEQELRSKLTELETTVRQLELGRSNPTNQLQSLLRRIGNHNFCGRCRPGMNVLIENEGLSTYSWSRY